MTLNKKLLFSIVLSCSVMPPKNEENFGGLERNENLKWEQLCNISVFC